MFKKLNSKGNTLGIVVIGIFILSILGTLILGLTATNYNMKINDKRAETTFYYAEKAMDELYTGIGNEVMNIVSDSYATVVQGYANLSNSLTSPAKDKAQKRFEELLRDNLTDAYRDGNVKLSADPTMTVTDVLLTRMNSSGFIQSVTGYDFEVYSPSGTPTSVVYYKNVVDASGNVVEQPFSMGDVDYNLVDAIEIKNIGVRCDSDVGEYSSSLIMDFKITVPDMVINFRDSKTKGFDLSNLSKFALVCEGYNLRGIHDANLNDISDRQKAPIIIDNNSNVTITGSVYADGTVYEPQGAATASGITYYKNNTSNVLLKNPSVDVGNNSRLRVNSKVFYCKNDLTLNEASRVDMYNRNGAGTTDTTDSLQFYANNIITKAGTNNATLNIAGGNTIIQDDLEINGDGSRVTIKGNYFGYGFRDDNNDGVEDDTNSRDVFGAGMTANNEHERSSAIIINGKTATIDMSTISKIILLGRAYIDLDPNGTNTSYMTGESLSYKGNQDLYLADTELTGSKVISNPIKYGVLNSQLGGALDTGTAAYSDLNLADSGSVIAKRAEIVNPLVAGALANTDLYFFVRNTNPAAQTAYFRNLFTSASASAKIAAMETQLGPSGINVQSVSLNPIASYYFSGAVMTAANVSGSIAHSAPVSGTNMASSFTPSAFVNVVKNRIENLDPSLTDLSEQYVLGVDNTTDNTAIDHTIANPYEYYIDREQLIEDYGTGRVTKRIQLNNDGSGNTAVFGLDSSDTETAKALTAELKDKMVNEWHMCTDADFTNGTYNDSVGWTISNEGGLGGSNIELKAGIIVGESPYRISDNFSGLILNYGEMTISGTNVNITANPELTTWLFEHCKPLQDVLSDEVFGPGSLGDADTGKVVGKEDDSEISLTYTDLVKRSNWRRDLS